MKSLTPTEFQKIIYDFYAKEKRYLPWRETNDPYRIMISEIMLQQTQVSRVIEKYQQWIEVFPTVKTLAEAKTAEVLKYWQGLGYNRRALNLQRAAQIIMVDFGGKVPERFDQLLTLPGIGPYTAAAICAFAFNRPLPLIETNIRRVYLHFYFPDEELIGDKQLMPLIEETLDSDNPRDWYYALMDYGSQLPKVIANPNRRSKHYTKQSKFIGSNRQARGQILKHLLEYGKSSKISFFKKLQLEHTKIEQSLDQLLDEGFIVQDKKSYTLK